MLDNILFDKGTNLIHTPHKFADKKQIQFYPNPQDIPAPLVIRLKSVDGSLGDAYPISVFNKDTCYSQAVCSWNTS